MRTFRRAVAVALATLAVATAAGSAEATPVASHATDRAYPQTHPKAGQYCTRIHRGVVTRAANGRPVRCTPEGRSRQRWRYL